MFFHSYVWWDHKIALDSSIEEVQVETRDIYILRKQLFHNNYKRLEENDIPFTVVDEEEWKSIVIKERLFRSSPFEVGFKEEL